MTVVEAICCGDKRRVTGYADVQAKQDVLARLGVRNMRAHA